MELLNKIQRELKVPKSQFNTYEVEKPDSLEERVEPDTNDAGQFPAEGSDLIPF
jgi:hypothetical protein